MKELFGDKFNKGVVACPILLGHHRFPFSAFAALKKF